MKNSLFLDYLKLFNYDVNIHVQELTVAQQQLLREKMV